MHALSRAATPKMYTSACEVTRVRRHDATKSTQGFIDLFLSGEDGNFFGVPVEKGRLWIYSINLYQSAIYVQYGVYTINLGAKKWFPARVNRPSTRSRWHFPDSFLFIRQYFRS
jgi:hypothetical protein